MKDFVPALIITDAFTVGMLFIMIMLMVQRRDQPADKTFAWRLAGLVAFLSMLLIAFSVQQQ